MADHSKRSSSNRNSPRSGASNAKNAGPSGQVRIIAGHWRGRKLPVAQVEGLRPTGDRVRETVFNWLQMQIPGCRCLDLFAGSGALGIEAASRGAAHVTLVEASSVASSSLRQTLQGLNAGDEVAVVHSSAEAFLATNPEPFDVIFIDPPFDLHIHINMLELLVPELLTPNGVIYLELPTKESSIAQQFPSSLLIAKEKRFGDVTVFLLRNES